VTGDEGCSGRPTSVDEVQVPPPGTGRYQPVAEVSRPRQPLSV
jgi:hypothetical protein